MDTRGHHPKVSQFQLAPFLFYAGTGNWELGVGDWKLGMGNWLLGTSLFAGIFLGEKMCVLSRSDNDFVQRFEKEFLYE